MSGRIGIGSTKWHSVVCRIDAFALIEFEFAFMTNIGIDQVSNGSLSTAVCDEVLADRAGEMRLPTENSISMENSTCYRIAKGGKS